MSTTPQELLDRAAYLLDEFGWCRRNYAINREGETVTPKDPDVVAFCAVGSLQRAALDLDVPTWQSSDNAFLDACNIVADRVGRSITHWNDAYAKPGEVQSVFRSLAGSRAPARRSPQQLLRV